MEERMELPQAFCGRMEKLLGIEWEAFLASYAQDRYYGLRYNPLKASREEFIARMPYRLEPVSWAQEGFYYRGEEQPGRDILHEAGAYYIQEPSAMAVVEILDPQPGEKILDLCAAPGGKSTQIAGRMKGQGLLVANEIIPGRSVILSQNVERMGIRNCVVCNEAPERMADFFPGFFDRIVVDAPCSGEGMFRKDETAVVQWSTEQVEVCADRQRMILEEAARMLKPGGILVYSTCTFAPDENEGTISRFVQAHSDFIIEKVSHDAAFADGRPDWIANPAEGIADTMRLWPHRLSGEGHYIARLARKKTTTCAEEQASAVEGKKQSDRRRTACRDTKMHKRNRDNRADLVSGTDLQAFLTSELGLVSDWLEEQPGSALNFGQQIYLVPDGMIPLQGLKVIRPGLHIATDRKNRLEPAHALAHALTIEETAKHLELSHEDAVRYLHGESLYCETQKGWILLSYSGYPLGFGKAVNGQIKNHYPKGIRK